MQCFLQTLAKMFRIWVATFLPLVTATLFFVSISSKRHALQNVHRPKTFAVELCSGKFMRMKFHFTEIFVPKNLLVTTTGGSLHVKRTQ